MPRNPFAIGLVLLALVASLISFSAVVGQAREARAAAELARQEARRATAIKHFLASVFRTGDLHPGPDGPRGDLTARQLLDLHAPRVEEQFADDPIAQIELLDMLASSYRELGEEARSQALEDRKIEHLGRLHGDAHPSVIQALLGDASRANRRKEYMRALDLLERADPLIHQAGLDPTATRARWWLARSEVLAPDGSPIDRRALGKALDLYGRLPSADPGFVEALTRLGWGEMDGDPAKAERHFLHALERASGIPQVIRVELQGRAWQGLARSREEQGRYEAAIEAYERAAALVGPTRGAGRGAAWAAAVQDASRVHRYGHRERALAQFERLMTSSPPDADGEVEHARALYAERLAAEGRPLLAVPLLEAPREVDGGMPGGYGVGRDLLLLGDAYDRGGLHAKAGDAIKAGLEQRLGEEPSDSGAIGIARERWGRFLLEQGDLERAEEQFDQVLVLAGGRNIEMAVLAYGGLARMAQARQDWESALAASTHAVVGFENLVGRHDVRTGPRLWLIHAESLRRVADFASARIWALRALEASRRYDAPQAASIQEAEAMLARLEVQSE